MLGREAAPLAPTPIRKARTPRERCCASSSSTRPPRPRSERRSRAPLHHRRCRANCCARKVQRPQGQHDDLARLSRTRSGEGGRRGSPAAGLEPGSAIARPSGPVKALSRRQLYPMFSWPLSWKIMSIARRDWTRVYSRALQHKEWTVDKETRPPPRYNEGTLIEAMQNAWRFVDDEVLRDRLKEAKGIGTPATRAEIIGGLKKQSFLMAQGKHIGPPRPACRCSASSNKPIRHWSIRASRRNLNACLMMWLSASRRWSARLMPCAMSPSASLAS